MAALAISSADVLSGTNGKDAEIAMARAMIERLDAAGQRSTAELLQALRQAFPESPLSVRIAALKALSLR